MRQSVAIPAINLTSTHAVTVAFWSKRSYSTTGNDALLESTADFRKSTTGFALFPDDAACSGIQAAIKGDVGETANCYQQPTSEVWHHFVLVLDKTQSAGNQVALYIDGVLQSPTRSLEASTNTNDFGDNPIWLFSQGGTRMFDSGQLHDLRIYGTALSAAQIGQIYRNAALVSLAVSPASVSISSGAPQKFTATGTYADGSQRDLTNSVTWSSLVPGVAAMTRQGSIIGLSLGETTIKATLSGVSASARMTVTAAPSPMNALPGQPSDVGVTTGSGITLELHGVHDNGSVASNSAALSIGTPTAGDLITCEVTFDGHNGNALASLTDNNNGSYVAAVPMHLNTTLIQVFGIYYKQAVAGSATTITLRTTNSQQWSAISCQAWKGAAQTSALDTAFVQSRDALATANPTTGPNKTPAGNGEVVIAGLGLYSSGTPNAGTNYALIDSAAATQWWPEYWIQSNATATAGNYVRGSDNFTDMMAAFKPASTSSFTISASPASLTVVQGNSGTATITTAVSGGFNNAITLAASGIPTGTTATFGTNPIAAPGAGNSILALAVGSTTAVGTYAITITGTGGAQQHSTTVTLKVTSQGSFSIAASPTALTIGQGSSGAATITTAVSGGFNNAITLSTSGLPTGTAASFATNPIAAPGAGSSTLALSVGSTAAGTYTITVTGTGGGLQQSTTVSLTVTAAPNFTITASPTTISVIRGNQATSTVTTAVGGGFNSTISVSASGVPTGTTVSFATNPIPAPGSGSSVITIAVSSSTETGTYPITVTGSGGGLQRSVTITLTVGAQVALAWTASTSQVVGYNAYRATQSNGPYTLLNTGLITGTSYMDQTAQSGLTYYYVTTAVNSQGQESGYSNQAAATVH